MTIRLFIWICGIAGTSLSGGCLCQFVRLSVFQVTFVIVKLWNIKTTWKGNIISSMVRSSTIFNFSAPAWKVRQGHLVIGSSVGPSICPSVLNSVPLTNKVRYFKFGWWYSNHTWNVSSSIGCTHFNNITIPYGGAGLTDFAIFDFVAAGGIRVSQTHALFLCFSGNDVCVRDTGVPLAYKRPLSVHDMSNEQ